MDFEILYPFLDDSIQVKVYKLETKINGCEAFLVQSTDFMIEQGFGKIFIITTKVSEDKFYKHSNWMVRDIDLSIRAAINDYYYAESDTMIET